MRTRPTCTYIIHINRLKPAAVVTIAAGALAIFYYYSITPSGHQANAAVQ